mmetsp:Transcript_55687/g.111656  ORF Transcript_55687/g.111656 Transcript_55687/m.111656 type:complete len:318 (-) Transcript_55687:122-1075(-)
MNLLRTVIFYLTFTYASAGAGSGSAGGADWRFFAAGGISAATSHGITTPIDVVKTKMQLSPAKYGSNVGKAAALLVKEEGMAILATGLAPTVVGYGIEGALKFGFYELFKPIFGELTPSKFLNFLLASVVAGAVASVVLCPCEDARIRMVGDPSFADGLADALAKLVREDGFLAMFAGLGAMLAKQVPYTMSKQVSFDFIASFLYALEEAVRQQAGECTPSTALAITFGSAALTSVIACITSQPGDVILTETYKAHGQGPEARLGAVSRRIYASQGLGGFFVGLQARLAHVGGIITSQLAIYDAVKQAFGLAATGSH